MGILGRANITKTKNSIIRWMGDASVAICGAKHASLVEFKLNVFTEPDDAI